MRKLWLTVPVALLLGASLTSAAPNRERERDREVPRSINEDVRITRIERDRDVRTEIDRFCVDQRADWT